MTAIWHRDGSGWRLLTPAGFPAEAALHELVEQAPHILPLAGSPRLAVLGKEVLLGGNYADLIAVEPTGRLVVVEIKLARNAEARRAVIAQILTYAAYLRGLDRVVLEQDILGSHLRRRGYASLAEAASANDQEGIFDEPSFNAALAKCLGDGRFRLVLVLDDAPEELVRLVGYLEVVADKLTIDLVTVAAYEVAGSQVIVPQRVDPERVSPRPSALPEFVSSPQGQYVEGASDFESAIAASPSESQPLLQRLTEWAKDLERAGLVKLGTYHGVSGRLTLLPRLLADNVGLVTIGNDHGPYLQFHRSVFERRAPTSLARIEQLDVPPRVGKGTITKVVGEDLLAVLTDAYREADSGYVRIEQAEQTEQT